MLRSRCRRESELQPAENVYGLSKSIASESSVETQSRLRDAFGGDMVSRKFGTSARDTNAGVAPAFCRAMDSARPWSEDKEGDYRTVGPPSKEVYLRPIGPATSRKVPVFGL